MQYILRSITIKYNYSMCFSSYSLKYKFIILIGIIMYYRYIYLKFILDLYEVNMS